MQLYSSLIFQLLTLKTMKIRKICIKTPESTSSSAGGSLMRFVKKIPPCLGCGVPCKDSSICHHCKPNESEIYIKTLEDLSRKQSKFSGFWTQCQRCQVIINFYFYPKFQIKKLTLYFFEGFFTSNCNLFIKGLPNILQKI
jgi:hypothetical protein